MVLAGSWWVLCACAQRGESGGDALCVTSSSDDRGTKKKKKKHLTYARRIERSTDAPFTSHCLFSFLFMTIIYSAPDFFSSLSLFFLFDSLFFFLTFSLSHARPDECNSSNKRLCGRKKKHKQPTKEGRTSEKRRRRWLIMKSSQPGDAAIAPST